MSNDFKNNAGYKILQEVAAKAIVDADYRRKLIANPNAELKQAGLEIPDGVRVVVHQNSARRLHLVLPSAVGECPPVPPGDVNVFTAFSLTHMF